MLGEILVEGKWKIVGMRVLADSKLEFTFQETGKMLGVEYSGIATVVSWPIPGGEGTVYGEGNAMMTTKDGDSVIWKGMGVGKPTGKGMAVKYRGAKSFQTTSPKLARLNLAPLVFEGDADENGDGWHKHWEWK